MGNVIIRPSAVWIGRNKYPRNRETIAMAKRYAKEKGVKIYSSYTGEYMNPSNVQKNKKRRSTNPFATNFRGLGI